MARRGAFIVFEGCDRAGKTTQCKKLVDALNKRNISAEFMYFPDRSTTVGRLISDYLTKKIELPDKAVHLLFAANRWELESQIRQKVSQGTSLVVDRYSFSGVAFSAAKKGMSFEWCWNPEVGLPKPDAVFLLKISDEALKLRGGFGNERYEVSDFQKIVWQNFKQMEDSTWQEINADKSEEDLHSELIQQFLEIYEKSASTPLEVFQEPSKEFSGAQSKAISKRDQ